MNVFAYLDPGTGTIIVQAVLGGAAGLAVLFKTMGSRFTRKRKPETRDKDAVDAVSEDPTVPTHSTE